MIFLMADIEDSGSCVMPFHGETEARREEGHAQDHALQMDGTLVGDVRL